MIQILSLNQLLQQAPKSSSDLTEKTHLRKNAELGLSLMCYSAFFKSIMFLIFPLFV